MLKKIIAVLLIYTLCLGIAPVAFAENEAITVELNGELIQFDTEPVMVNDRVMVPIRAIIEAVGATVSWDETTQAVSAVLDSTTVSFNIGDTIALVNGTETDMYGGAMLIGERTLVSARFVGEAFGLTVDWDDAASKVIITGGKKKDLGNSYKVVSVTASGDDGNVPENVIDGNYNSRWSCETSGAELILELEDVVPVGYVGIACYVGDERQTTVAFDISEDGVSYTEVVPKMLTSITLAMEPVSFGEACNAKFVRLRGYGNTNNAWNSITELKVYAPQEDGSMPVDMSAPAAAAGDLSSVPQEVRDALGVVEEYFVGIPVWLANLYDPESKGFFAAMSGRDDPNIDSSLEVTSWGLNLIRSYMSCWTDMPDDIRQGFIDYFNARQDPVTGMYIDLQGPANDRETARNNAAALGSMTNLKSEPLYPHPSRTASTDATSSEAATVMPDYMASVDSYIKWIESWNWDTNSWTAGDQTQQSLNYLKMLPETQAAEYEAALFEWLEARQDPVTGLWGTEINFNSASGAFKVGLIYQSFSKQIPNAEKVVDSIIASYDVDSPANVYYVRNPLSVLNQMKGYSPELAAKIQDGVLKNIDKIADSIAKFYCPDGGFSANYQKAMSSFGGVTTSHGLYEGDIDATMMAIIARTAVYTIFDVRAPKLESSDFWAWIKGEKEVPSPYKDESILETASGEVMIDFEEFEAGSALKGDEFGGAAVAAGLKVTVENDIDLRNNKVLKLSYDGTQSSGPNIKIGGGAPKIRFERSSKTSVVEFKVKLEDNTASNNMFISFGNTGAYALSIGGNGNQRITARVASDNVAYGGTLTTLAPRDWYKVRLEYQINEDGKDAAAKIYVDGELVSKNNYYTNSHLGTAPVSMDTMITVTYYRAGTGSIYLDDIKMYTE